MAGLTPVGDGSQGRCYLSGSSGQTVACTLSGDTWVVDLGASSTRATKQSIGLGSVDNTSDATKAEPGNAVGDAIRARAAAGVNSDIAALFGPQNAGIAFGASSGTIGVAPTTDFGSVGVRKVSVAGKGTISSFGPARNAEVKIRFTNYCTIVHDPAKIIVPGGQNILLAPEDKVDASSDNTGVWTVWNVTRARTPDVFNACDYGLIGDGNSHPLSERYATLAAAQAVYPHAASLNDEIDWAATQLAVNLASARTNPTEDTVGSCCVPAGLKLRFNRTLDFNIPIIARIHSNVEYAGSGACYRVGGQPPTRGNIGYDIELIGARCITGLTGDPTGVQEGGSIGLHILCMQMSRVKVIGKITLFTWAGVFLDARGVLWYGEDGTGIRPNVQQNKFDFGYLPQNGINLLVASPDGERSVGANQTTWSDLQSGYTNLKIDGRVQGVDYQGSTSNRWEGIVEVPAPPRTQTTVECHAPFNVFLLPFIEGYVLLAQNTYCNTVIVDNPWSDTAYAIDQNTSGGNSVQFGVAAKNPDVPEYKTSFPVTAGQPMRNTTGRSIAISLYADLSPSTSADAAVDIFTGPTNGALSAYSRAAVKAGGAEQNIPITIIVPTNWYYVMNVTGAVAFSNAKMTPLQ